jgi:hypothetical protein
MPHFKFLNVILHYRFLKGEGRVSPCLINGAPRYEDWWESVNIARHCMAVSGQPQSPRPLYSRRKSSQWAPEPVGKPWSRQKSFTLPEIETRPSSPCTVAIPTDPPRLLYGVFRFQFVHMYTHLVLFAFLIASYYPIFLYFFLVCLISLLA